MSGGSLNYLYCKDPDELFNYITELEFVEEILLQGNYNDIARDVRRLTEYIKTSYNRIDVLSEQLKGVFKAVEWFQSCDYGKKELVEALERYRKDYTEVNT